MAVGTDAGAGAGVGPGEGAAELAAAKLGAFCISTSAPLLLDSLLTWAFSPGTMFSLLLPAADAETGMGSSAVSSGRGLGGAVQRGSSQTTPVKLLRVNPPLVHFRQGLPDRSRARRPALIAPMLALGPSLCAAKPPRPPSMVPSSLRGCQSSPVKGGRCRREEYSQPLLLLGTRLAPNLGLTIAIHASTCRPLNALLLQSISRWAHGAGLRRRGTSRGSVCI